MKPDYINDERRSINRLEAEIAALRKALCTALAWMAQSANTPLRGDEVRTLIDMAQPDRR